MAESKRTERIALNLRPEEDKTMEDAAEAVGLPVATYTRLKALEGAREDLAQLGRDRADQRQPQPAAA